MTSTKMCRIILNRPTAHASDLTSDKILNFSAIGRKVCCLAKAFQQKSNFSKGFLVQGSKNATLFKITAGAM